MAEIRTIDFNNLPRNTRERSCRTTRRSSTSSSASGPPQRFTVSFTSYSDPAFKSLIKDGPSDSQVYEVMARRAFDELSQKVQDKFFQKRPTPKVTASDDSDDDN